MKHRLEDHHHEHLRNLGVKHGKKHIFIPQAEYEQHAKAWRRTLPNATEAEIHMKVIGHHASKVHALRHHQKPTRPERLAWAIITLLLILIACTLFAPKAHGQYSKINSIQFQQDGANISGAFFTYPFTINCTVNVTCSIVGGKLVMNATASGSGITTLNTLTDAVQTLSVTNDTNVTGSWTSVSPNHALVLGWTGTLAKGRTLGTTVYTDQANTWSASTQEMDQGANGNVVLKMKRFTDSSPTGTFFLIRNAADNTLLFSINRFGRTDIEADDNSSTSDLTLGNQTAAVSSASTQQGRHIDFTNAFWNGVANGFNTWTIGTNALTGSNPTTIFSFSSSQTSGSVPTGIVQVPILNAVSGYQLNGSAKSFSNTKAAVSGQPLLSYDASTGNFTQGALTATNVGLGSVTNDAQTKAAVVPNTAPTTGQILAGNAGGTAYAPVSMSQDCSITSAGVITCTKTNNVSFAASATTNTTSATNITSGTLPAAQMPALTGECTTSAGAVSVTCGSGIAHIVVAGTSTFTTSAVASGACQTTVTTAATGAVASTDTMSWNWTTAPVAATDARLRTEVYITADNVNFMRCNPTAASVTPTALVARWKVLR